MPLTLRQRLTHGGDPPHMPARCRRRRRAARARRRAPRRTPSRRRALPSATGRTPHSGRRRVPSAPSTAISARPSGPIRSTASRAMPPHRRDRRRTRIPSSSSIASRSEKRSTIAPPGVGSPAPTSSRSCARPATKMPPSDRPFQDRRGKRDHPAVVQRRLADLVHRAADPQQPFAFGDQRAAGGCPFQKYSTSSVSRPRRTDATNAISSLSFSAGASKPTSTPAGTPGASSPASAITVQSVVARPGRSPRWRVRRRSARRMPHGLPRSAPAADAAANPASVPPPGAAITERRDLGRRGQPRRERCPRAPARAARSHRRPPGRAH